MVVVTCLWNDSRNYTATQQSTMVIHLFNNWTFTEVVGKTYLKIIKIRLSYEQTELEA